MIGTMPGTSGTIVSAKNTGTTQIVRGTVVCADLNSVLTYNGVTLNNPVGTSVDKAVIFPVEAPSLTGQPLYIGVAMKTADPGADLTVMLSGVCYARVDSSIKAGDRLTPASSGLFGPAGTLSCGLAVSDAVSTDVGVSDPNMPYTSGNADVRYYGLVSFTISDGLHGLERVYANSGELAQPRIVRNVLPRDAAVYTDWTSNTAGSGTITSSALQQAVVLKSGGSGRAYISKSVSFTANQAYCLKIKVSGLTGTPVRPFIYLGTDVATGERSVVPTSDGTWCIRFTYGTTASRTINIGIGTDATEAVGVIATISEWQLEEIDSITAAPGEYTYPGQPLALRYENGNTVASNVVTYAKGARIFYGRPKTAVLIGDSQSAGETFTPFTAPAIDSSWAVTSDAFVGKTLLVSESLIDCAYRGTILTQNIVSAPSAISYASLNTDTIPASYIIAFLGVNDILGGATLSTLQGSVTSWLNETRSVGGPTLVLATVPPFANYVAHTAGMETVRLAYNSWLLTYVGEYSDVLVYDAATPLTSTSASDELAAAYDSGDGLHLNSAGHTLVMTGFLELMEAHRSGELGAGAVTLVSSVTADTVTADVLSVPDGGSTAARIEVGTGGDLKVYHDGTNSVIRSDSRPLFIYPTGSGNNLTLSAGGSTALIVSGTNQLVTCSKGITVNTTAASSAFAVADGTGFTSAYQQITITSSSTNPAMLALSNGSASGGDPFVRYSAVGLVTWSHGVDVTDSSWRVSQAAALGTNDYLLVSPQGNTTLANRSSAAGPTLTVDQNDTDEPFINFDGSSAASAAANISTWTNGATLQGYIRVAINGTDAWIAYHTAPTS